MADWYVSSVNWNAVAQFVVSHAYNVGDLLRPLTNPANTAWVYRCTTAGTSAASEPTWTGAVNNNSTVTSGGATFTNVTGQSAYGWSAAGGMLYGMTNNYTRVVNGDRIFIASDHAETNSGTANYAFGSNGFALIQMLSVNRAGSVPPVAADLQSGAAMTISAADFTLDAYCDLLWQGITFTQSGTGRIRWNNTGNKSQYFKNCAFAFSNASNTSAMTTGLSAKVVLDNTTLQFANASQYIGGNFTGTQLDLTWINTPSAIQGATLPTTLFGTSLSGWSLSATLRGIDLSAFINTLVTPGSTGGFWKLLLDSCRISSTMTIYATPANTWPTTDEIELVNCYDGTNVRNERYTAAGTITTDRTITMSSGAADDIGAFSVKLVSSSRSDVFSFPLNCFAFDVENTAIGSSKTATVEIISSGLLNNNDLTLLLEYMGTAGNAIASFGGSLATVLTPAAALPSSSATWNNPPATPQKQKLQITFTPQRAGRVRGLMQLGKTSTTVWVNPQIIIA